MADKIRNNTFLIKRSNIPGKVPAAGSILLGELALNTSDAILYTSGTTANTILPIGWDRVARTGDTMTGGLFTPFLTATTISATSINKVDYIVFNTGTTSAATVPGTVYFDNTEKALSYNTSINQGVTVNLGQQNYIRVFNNSGTDIPRGKALEILSAYSGLPAVTLAVNKHDGFNIIGVSSEIIPNGKEGIAITNGIISNIELTGMSVGSLIYASDTVPGKLDDATKYLTFPLTARTNSIGFVIQTGTTTGKLFVDIQNENSVLSLTDLQRNVLEGNVISTGAFEFTGITTASTTTINISNVKGWIVQNTYQYDLRPDVIYVEYSGGTNITLTNLLTSDTTFILINSGGTVVQQITFPTPQERRENIYLGKVIHPSRSTIQNINVTVDFDVSPMSALRDLWTPLKLINQGIVLSANGGNLNINTSAGTLWGNGIGWVTNQLNPDSVSISGTSPTIFQYRVQTGGTFSNTTTIDVANYDLNGIVTAVGGGAGSSTNQRVYLFPTGIVRVQYGQKVYGTLAEAVAGTQSEAFIEYFNNRDNGILIGIISVNKNATLLNNTGQAIFHFVSKFGEVLGGTGGLSTTTLQQAYDNSSQPEITINSTLDGLSIKNGTGNADNVTRLLEGINAVGNVTSYIRADGDISGTTLQTNGFTANTTGISAATVNIRTIGSGTPITNLGVDINGNVVSGTTGGSTFTGGTVTGPTYFTNGLTANTFSATTYYNLPIDIYSTGGTYNGGNIYVTNNTGGTFTITGLTSTGFSANYYGSFSDTTTQPILTADTAIAWTYNTTELSNGISIANNSQIKVANKGVYEIGYSAQIQKTGIGTSTDVTIWARINGNNVSRTSSTLGFANNNTYQLPFVSFLFELEANDYVEFYFSSPSTNVQITTISASTSPIRPIAPSVIIVAKQVGLSVTDNLSGYYLPLSGGTVTGSTKYTNGLTANTISATTYYNLPIDIRVTGGTYSSGSTIFTNNTGGTFSVTGFSTGNTTLYWYDENNTPPTTAPIATGSGSIALGDGAQALGDNMFVYGTNAGSGATNAYNSNFLGLGAGKGVTGAVQTNFFGDFAGQNATTVDGANFIGYYAGQSSTGSSASNFIGGYAGYGAIDNSLSNFLGQFAGQSALSSYNSNFFGASAGVNSINNYDSNFFGYNAGYTATGSDNSNFLGNSAGYYTTNASGSNFLGNSAGYNSINSYYSNFIGEGTGGDTTNSYHSNFFGNQAGNAANYSNNSNFIGQNAGYQATSASGSTFIGLNAGNLVLSGWNSNFIGGYAGDSSNSSSYTNFFGYESGYLSNNSIYSNFIGRGAGISATTSYNSNFIGLYAGRRANGSYYSNFIGNNAGYESSGNTYGNFIGLSAGYQSTGNTYGNFIGTNAGYQSSGNSSSNFIGQNAGFQTNSSSNVNFIGNQAGYQSSGNSSSNFIGQNAGYGVSGSTSANFIGNQVGRGASNSDYSIFIGSSVGYSASTSQFSNFFGYYAGYLASGSSYSNMMGQYAGNGATNATYNNFFGARAGEQSIDTVQSNAIGYLAGQYGSNTDYSNFIGSRAGYSSSTSTYSNFIGRDAGYTATGVTYSNFIGPGAGYGASTSSYSNLFGFQAGKTFTGNSIGSNNIIIGKNISLPNATTNAINIGGVLFGINTYTTSTGDPSIVARSTGKIGINVVTPTEALHVSGNTLIQGGLTANTISATTYFNLPTDIRVTGSTYSNNTFTYTNNTGGTFNVLFNTVTGLTSSGTISSSVLSATTYLNLPTDIRVTGATYSNNTFTYTNNTGGTFNTLFNTVTGLTTNGNLTVTGNTSMIGTLSVTGNTNVKAITGTSATISGSGSSILTVIGSGTTTPIFSVQGSSGELFSVTDSLTGSLFSVNDISGLPIVEVFSDNTILMGNYLAPALNTTAKISLTAGTNSIYSIPTSAYTGAFVDYTVINSGATSARAGNIMTIWNSGSTQYTEVSTNDIGSTTGITFSTALVGSNAIISASATTAGWTLKTIIRAI